MSNETIMQGLLDSLMKRPEDATQQRGALLANIMNTPNPLAATVASMLPGQMANVNQAARGLFGLQAPVSPAQKLQEMITANPALMNSSAGLKQLAQLAADSGDRATALQLSAEAAQVQQKEAAAQQEGALRESLAAKATRFGLESVATTLLQGGKVDDAAKAIAEFEKQDVLARGGRPAKIAIAQSVGAGPAMVMGIARGDYDAMSPSDFQNTLEGSDADLKPFLDTSGKARIYKTSQFGRVLDEAAGTWKNPGELGLKPAATEQRVITAMDNFGKGVFEGEATKFLERSQKADDAVLSLQRNQQAVALLDEGIKTGAYANFRLGLSKAFKQMGVITGNSEAEEIANTETYMVSRASEVANVIKAFGAGTGLSDDDRRYAEKIAVGDITLDEKAMRNLLAMERVANTNLINTFNTNLDKYKQAGMGGESIEIYRKALPALPPARSQIDAAVGSNTAANPTVVRMPNGSTAYLIDGRWLYPDGTEAK